MKKYIINVDLTVEAENERQAKELGFDILDGIEDEELENYNLNHVDEQV